MTRQYYKQTDEQDLQSPTNALTAALVIISYSTIWQKSNKIKSKNNPETFQFLGILFVRPLPLHRGSAAGDPYFPVLNHAPLSQIKLWFGHRRHYLPSYVYNTVNCKIHYSRSICRKTVLYKTINCVQNFMTRLVIWIRFWSDDLIKILVVTDRQTDKQNDRPADIVHMQ